MHHRTKERGGKGTAVGVEFYVAGAFYKVAEGASCDTEKAGSESEKDENKVEKESQNCVREGEVEENIREDFEVELYWKSVAWSPTSSPHKRPDAQKNKSLYLDPPSRNLTPRHPPVSWDNVAGSILCGDSDNSRKSQSSNAPIRRNFGASLPPALPPRRRKPPPLCTQPAASGAIPSASLRERLRQNFGSNACWTALRCSASF